MTEVALIATSTRKPAASNRICPIARRRVASGVTAISRHVAGKFKRFPRGRKAPSQEKPTSAKLVPADAAFLGSGRSTGRLAGQILFQPVDMIVAVDNVGLAD